MKQVAGIYLPDDDNHFGPGLETSPKIDGKGTYQLNKLNLALQHVSGSRRNVAFDIGAHVGLWSRILDTEFSEVIAFEPLPTFVECFVKNAPGVKLHECALGNQNGRAVMTLVPGNSGNSHIGMGDPLEPVRGVIMRRLDDIEDLPVPDFVKIDVEGFEAEVLRGGEQTIRKHHPVMIVECKPGNAERHGLGQREAVEILRSWGAYIVAEKAGDVVLKWI